MKITYMTPNELVPYDKNPRINDESVDLVANSIQEFGFKQPIVIDKNNVIIAGHTRWKAAKKLNLKEVPVIQADDLSPAQVKAYRLADNKVGEASEWDFDLLADELEDLADEFDMSAFGFEDEEDIDTAEAVEDNYEPDIPTEPMTKSGQVWQLGKHRLMIGDSTSPEDVEELCDGDVMDLVVTDPPYNVAIENSQGMTIENDNMDSTNFQEFLTHAFENLNDHLKAGGAFYIWYASRTHMDFEQALRNVGLEVREQLIWNKNALVLGRQDYQWKHEPCLYGWKDGASHYFINTRTLTTVCEETEGGVARPRLVEERRAESNPGESTRCLSGSDCDQREKACKERLTSYDEAYQAYRKTCEEQLKTRREGSGFVRRFRLNADSLRAIKPQMLHDGVRPEIRRCHHRQMAGADWRKGGACEWLM